MVDNLNHVKSYAIAVKYIQALTILNIFCLVRDNVANVLVIIGFPTYKNTLCTGTHKYDREIFLLISIFMKIGYTFFFGK